MTEPHHEVRRMILGLPFFSGTDEQAVAVTLAGALVMAPSGPGLAHDLCRYPEYRAALESADLLLPDSGAMVLQWNWMHALRPAAKVRRLSGLRFLRALLAAPEVHDAATFWVMPSAAEGEADAAWLREHGFAGLRESDLYVAPKFSRESGFEDPELLRRLEAARPRFIFLNVGGGVQEPLGTWLQKTLSYRPAILCTGAALAFLTGQQAAIPVWADQVYLGWLLRILSAPRRFVPRYWRALSLVWLLLRHGSARPPDCTCA